MGGKRLLAGFGIIVVAILITGFLNDARGADWVRVRDDSGGLTRFYDRESITYSQKGIVKVWAKLVPNEDRRKAQFDYEMKKGEAKDTANAVSILRWDHSLVLLDVNCQEKIVSILSETYYDKENNVLKSHKFKSSENWFYVTPDSIGDTLHQLVCVK